MSERALKYWEGLSVGDVLPELCQQVDQTMINAYADASGDINPLHIDPEFAKTTIFGKTIAHGLLTLAFVSRVLSHWNWHGWAYGGELDIAFLGPVYPGNEVRVSGEVTAIIQSELGVFAHCELACSCDDKVVLKGKAVCQI